MDFKVMKTRAISVTYIPRRHTKDENSSLCTMFACILDIENISKHDNKGEKCLN